MFLLMIFLMAGPAWPDIVEIVGALLAILLGIGGVPRVMEWLKALTGWRDRRALALSVAVSVFFAAMTLIAEGTIGPGAFAWSNAGLLITTIWLASQMQFQKLRQNGQASLLAERIAMFARKRERL